MSHSFPPPVAGSFPLAAPRLAVLSGRKLAAAGSNRAALSTHFDMTARFRAGIARYP